MSAPRSSTLPGAETEAGAGVRGEPARLVRVVGTLVEARPCLEASLYELVRVGERSLLGEVIRVEGDRATIQVFEETSGLALGEPVVCTGAPLAAELGPGLLGSVLDGVGRPLERLAERYGRFIAPGGTIPMLGREREWDFEPLLEPGAVVSGGDFLGRVEERPGLAQGVPVPPGVAGTLAELAGGPFRVDEPVGFLEDGRPLFLHHTWPVRRPRPAARRLPGDRPLVTGQRVFDLLFPLAEGGTVAVPGGFGTGKTIIEQALAKYVSADVVVYIGCGERGNEMAELLEEFPRLEDPRSGRSLMERTVLIVNTSNMPVAAREASIYLGITAAEYYRDLGYRVAVMADSLSRWAEALREIGSRLGELPGEEGYPTYLGNRLAKAYERAGRVRALGRPERDGALTFISAISPPGGDFSEPVTQASLRVVGGLWALESALAQQRQFPAVSWERSYSLYGDRAAGWFGAEVGGDWPRVRREMFALLQRDAELREIAALVGTESLEDRDRLAVAVARIARELVLGQSAFHPVDAYSPPARTFALASFVLALFEVAGRALAAGGTPDLERVRAALVALREAPEQEIEVRAAAVSAAIESLGAPAGTESGPPAEARPDDRMPPAPVVERRMES